MDANLTLPSELPHWGTPSFEKTILVWLPGVFLLSLLPLELKRIISSRAKNIPWSWLIIAKLVIVGVLIITDLASVTIATQRRNVYPAAEIAAYIIRFAIYALITLVLMLNRIHGLQVSYLIFLTSCLLVLCQTPDIFFIVSAFLNNKVKDDMKCMSSVFVYILQLGFFFLQLFCDKPPMYNERLNLKNPSLEGSASMLSRITFEWLTPLIRLGARKPLEVSDLYSLEFENTSRIVVPQFTKHWEASLMKLQLMEIEQDRNTSKGNFFRVVRHKASIVPALCKTFGPSIIPAVIIRICVLGTMFINPFLLKLTISFVSSDESLWRGCMYASLMLITSVLQTFFENHSNVIMNFVGNRVSTCLISVIYRKSLKLSNAAREQSTQGEIVNLMAVDASLFTQLLMQFNLIWFCPLQISLAIFFLWELLGPAVLAGLAVIILLVPVNGYIVNQSKLLRTKLMKCKDERLKIMNEILSGIKVLKLYAWEPSFEEQVSKIRDKELMVLRTWTYYQTIMIFFTILGPYLVSLASFSVFVLSDKSNILDAKTAFVSLSLFNILRLPIKLIPEIINIFVMAAVSVERLNKFLNKEELDPNLVLHDDSERSTIAIENGTFSWDRSDDSSIVLRDINMQVEKGALVAVVGTIGSGKSSLLAAILGEMEKISGKVNRKGSIAYVPQQAWIQNTTLQANITCNHEFDDLLFNKVIKACALEQDLEMLPGGVFTEIGEKGINLSGGQKQRISLARAVYSNADVYLLDDPLSAVDAHVGKHIFEYVIGPKSILKSKTRLLVTHSLTYLPDTDFIIVLKNGIISESGTYKQLIMNKGPFSEFLLNHMETTNEEMQESKEEILQDSTLPKEHNRPMSLHSSKSDKYHSLDRLETNKSKGSKLSLSKNITNDEKVPEKKKLLTVEAAATGNVKLSVYNYYIQAMGLKTAVITILGYIFYHTVHATTNLWLSKWTSDKTVIVNNTQDMSKTHMYLSVYGTLGIFQASSNFMAYFALAIGCLFATSQLHLKMLERIFKAPMSFFDTTPLGRIINRFSKDIDICDSLLCGEFGLFLHLSLQLVATVLVIVYSTPTFLAVIIPILIFYLYLQRYSLATTRQLRRLESATRSPIYSQFGETLQGIQSIRAYGMQEFFIDQFEQKVDTSLSCSYPSTLVNRWVSLRLESLSNLSVFFAALFAVFSRESITMGLAGLSISYAIEITQTSNHFVRSLANIETNAVAVERIKEYTEIVQEAAWIVFPRPNPSWPQKGEVEFQNYKLQYRKGLDLTLKGVTFSIKAGEKVGVVGRTGAGKSSLTLGLFRILEAAGGSIYLDGVDISKVGLHDLRNCLTIIPQDPVLFSGTLRDNLDPYHKESDEDLWKAIELSNLKVFVTSLSAGLNHNISEGGENLSVGQRQLICLSRALLRKSKLLILDEATAAVDLDTDDVIQRTIRTEFRHCTVLTIAHRLNTIMDYDRVLVLDKGEVKEFDSPTNLIMNTETVFYSLAKDADMVS